VEEKQLNKKKLIPIIIVVAAALIILLLGIMTLLKGGGDPVSTEPKEEITQFTDERTLFLSSGNTHQLHVVDGVEVTFISSNPSVATVDENGLVTAVAKGNALITISTDDTDSYCGVLVDATGNFIDVSSRTPEIVFSDVELEEPNQVTGIAVDVKNDTYYLSQPYGTTSYGGLASDIIVNKITKNAKGDWKPSEWMRFYESGTGRIAFEVDGMTPYLWLESNGTYYGSGTTFSRIEWENEGFGQSEFGATFLVEGIEGSASPTLDVKNNLVMVYDNAAKSYLLYDYEAVTMGEAPSYLAKINCPNGQLPLHGTDDSQGFYNASIRGFALCDGYIYQISGSSSIYISVFDLDGNLQYCHRVTAYDDTETRRPAGIVCVDGKVYIAVLTGSSSFYLANVWMYQ